MIDLHLYRGSQMVVPGHTQILANLDKMQGFRRVRGKALQEDAGMARALLNEEFSLRSELGMRLPLLLGEQTNAGLSRSCAPK